MRKSTVLLAILLVPSAALAQGADTTEPSPEPAADTDSASPTADPDAAPSDGASDAAPAEDAPAALPRWPRGVIDRPLTLPKGLFMGGVDVLAYKVPGVDSLQVLGDVALGYGVTDGIEISTITPTYAFALKDFEIKGALDVGVGVKVLRGAAGGKLEMIARLVAGYDLLGEAARPVRVGFHVQYNVTPKFAVFTHDIGSGNAGVSIAVDGDPKPVFATLPIGVGVQATPELWIEADTAPISALKISNAENVFISDITPVFVTGVYNLLGGHLDAIGYLGFGDVQHAGDTISFGAGVRYYAGAVD